MVTPPTQSILNAVVNVADNAGDVGGAGGENQSTHSKYKAREIGGEEEGMYMGQSRTDIYCKLTLIEGFTKSIGTSLRELVYRFRHKTLMLLKLLMLQRKVCSFTYSLSEFQFR